MSNKLESAIEPPHAYTSEGEASRWLELAVAALQAGANARDAIERATEVANHHEERLRGFHASMRRTLQSALGKVCP